MLYNIINAGMKKHIEKGKKKINRKKASIFCILLEILFWFWTNYRTSDFLTR